MKYAIAAALVALVVSSPAWAKDKNGIFKSDGNQSCANYSDAYSRTTLTGKDSSKGPHAWWGVSGWINGYITAYNQLTPNGKKDILGSMSLNAASKWIASWCRDNSGASILQATMALIKNLK